MADARTQLGRYIQTMRVSRLLSCGLLYGGCASFTRFDL